MGDHFLLDKLLLWKQLASHGILGGCSQHLSSLQYVREVVMKLVQYYVQQLILCG